MLHDDLTGKYFGNLYVEKFDHKDGARCNYYQCKCKCGNTIIARGVFLKKGVIKSCGCPVETVVEEEPPTVPVTIGQKVRFDPFRDMTSFGIESVRGKSVRGTVVYINESHKWFSVEYSKHKLRTSFNFWDIGHGVQVLK